MKTLLVTGSSGLIGSEVCRYFDETGWSVHGIDNNARAAFFGPQGDTRWNQSRLQSELARFVHHECDVRDREGVIVLLRDVRPDAIVHAAGQPSHDLAARIPFDDFETNAGGTLDLLEAARQIVPEAPFVYLSTNKVYGDAPNEVPLVEQATRWDYARPSDHRGISESCRIDQSMHSLFGASKLAADVLVQEYGRYFQMSTCCLRCGCVTGPNHSGVELHGFLSYLVKCAVHGTPYKIYGYKGKQVRDNIHAIDIARLIDAFVAAPRRGEVYNMGGGRENSVSVLEACDLAGQIGGRKMSVEYVDEARKGDHICYISDLTKVRSHFPGWSISVPLTGIIDAIARRWAEHGRSYQTAAVRGPMN